MSLLLDALKTRESSAPSSAESHDEALDGREALRILTAKMDASSALTLEAGPMGETDVDSAAPLDSAVPRRETAGSPRNSAMPHVVAAALPAGLPPLSPAAPLAGSPARRYAVMFAAAVVVVIIVMVAKSLLSRNSNPITYPAPAAGPQLAAVQPSAPPNPSVVQVPTRPASQFSGGSAPEIDLREDVLRPAANHAALGAVRNTNGAEKSATGVAAASNSSMPARRSISVTTSAGLSSIDKHIEAGYRALASGDVPTAQREYHDALDLDPNSIDALLGAASAAARAGNATLAATVYAKVLRLEPGNNNATAALAILNRDPTAVEANESRLKVMIASDTERRPALHAALAGVYAADRRWADAAQEYFIALSMDQGDANLAFNLAASLDQNHNAAAALTYYAQALAAAKLRPAQIDVHAIEARVSQLQARLELQPASPRAAP